ncbi:hypothetical protein [Actinomarinicola tropica]|uniref:Uncharacterized protein n=1 Tax=Actinomarinicola tropica TaxID=2789776 RepID=A0A5Q2RCM5_9ACTN|nr:hypothetical protein [Actinomarinicola tropica]QGG94639.1 hypothetical protein GH723_05675 [Actinomarinicola tropica]
MAASSVAAWSAALDEVEEGLRVADRIARGEADLQVPAWIAPAELGPLPAELAPRLRLVMASLEAVHGDLVEARERAAAELAELAEAARAPGRRPVAAGEPPAPRLVDHSA